MAIQFEKLIAAVRASCEFQLTRDEPLWTPQYAMQGSHNQSHSLDLDALLTGATLKVATFATSVDMTLAFDTGVIKKNTVAVTDPIESNTDGGGASGGWTHVLGVWVNVARIDPNAAVSGTVSVLTTITGFQFDGAATVFSDTGMKSAFSSLPVSITADEDIVTIDVTTPSNLICNVMILGASAP